MSKKLRFKISPEVAAYVRAGLSSSEKLVGLEAAADMSPFDHVTLLFCLMRDADVHVKRTGTAAFVALPEALLQGCIVMPGIHPAILDEISRFHYGSPVILSALLECPSLSPEARAFLGRFVVKDVSLAGSEVEPSEGDMCQESVDGRDDLEDLPEQDQPEKGLGDEELEGGIEGDEVDPELDVDEYFSKYQLIQTMGISEKIKMALTGDKEWRSILINDTNKLVSGSVIKNPRITDGEILRVLKVGVQNDEIIRLICDNREWVKNPKIRKALVDCPKTPLPNALRYLSSLGEKEIAAYAKSRNISSVISTAAKRIVLAKKR
jgi:hypothetical protein